MPWPGGAARVVRSVVVLGWVLCVCLLAESEAGEYDDPDAYEIYSLLLPGEESYGIAKATLVVQQETLVEKRDDFCLAAEPTAEFKDAIEDYKRHTEPMLLQRRFKIDKPYELVSTETIGTLIKYHNGNDFTEWYPDSGGIIRMTAVGFNRQRTLAIVRTESIPHPSAVDGGCNNLCGHDSIHLLKKTSGKWKAVPAVTYCFTVR